MMSLSEAEWNRGRVLCAKMQLIFVLIVGPAMYRFFLMSERDWIGIHKRCCLSSKKRRWRTGIGLTHDWLRPQEELSKEGIVRFIRNAFHWNWKTNLKDLVQFLVIILKPKEARIIKKEIDGFETVSLRYLRDLPEKHGLHRNVPRITKEALFHNVRLFEMMALDLEPGLQSYFSKRKIREYTDGPEVHKRQNLHVPALVKRTQQYRPRWRFFWGSTSCLSCENAYYEG